MAGDRLPIGGSKCRCRACGAYFKATRSFERHRVGEFTQIPPNYGRRCLTADEMRARGWEAPGDPPVWNSDSTSKRPRLTVRARRAAAGA